VGLAASATASAALVLASGLDDPARLSGLGLHLHPAATVAAVFDEELRAWKGVPQSVECTEHLHGTDPARRLWLLPVFAHPAGVAGMMPGFGPALMERMRQYPHLAAASAMLHDHGSGRVSADREGRPRLHYQLDPADGAALAHGMAEAARIWLAAGARVVLPPDGEPVTSLAGAERLRERPARPQDPPLIAVHPMGGLAMAGSPHRGPVDPEGRHRGLRGLWVADGSLFPTSTGGPPQLTIYAFGRMVGQAIAAA
jgi:choline dehydrogenase-like flavoprotein